MPYLGTKGLKASDIRRFNVTGSTSATHTLTWVAPTEQSLIVTINGVKQQEDAYSVSGTTLTLSSALVATDKMEVVGINDVGTTVTPAQNSVNLDKLATTGTPSSSTFLRGDMAWTAVSDTSGLSSMQVFTSSGTYTKPSGVTKVIVEVQGAGGSGSAVSTPKCFGAGGGYVKKLLDVSGVTSSTITVGTGGAGKAANAGVGNAGGSSSWNDGVNTTLTAGGGEGGRIDGTASAGGSATGGDFNVEGQGGGKSGYAVLSGGSFLGKTNGFEVTGLNLNSAPTGYGAGSGLGTEAIASVDGGNGIVIVTEYK